MSTPWTNENLNDYLDERLSPTERAELETIIRKDAVAVEALRELRRLRNSVRKAPRFKLDPDFATRVVAGLKQNGDQPLFDTIGRESAVDSASEMTTRAASKSLSASTWRTIAISMTAIAASLLLILIIRPDLSGGEILTRAPGTPTTPQPIAGEANGDNGAVANSDSGIANTLAPGSSGPETKNEIDQVANDSVDSSPEMETMAPGRTALPGVSEIPELAEVAPKDNVPVDSRSKEPVEFAANEPDVESIVQKGVASSGVKDTGDPAMDDSFPFQFDEVVFVFTTQDQIDSMIGVLNDDLTDRGLARDSSASDPSFHLQTTPNGLAGDRDMGGNDDKNDSVALVPKMPVDADHSTIVMAVEATPEQLDDFLKTIGAPASRIVEPLPKQIVSFNRLSPTHSIPDVSAGSGAGMNSGVDASEKERANQFAITIFEAAVLSSKQPDMKETQPKPAPPENVEIESTPVIRRYLIVLKTTEPETPESVK